MSKRVRKTVKGTVKKVVKTIKTVINVVKRTEEKTLECIESNLNIALKVILIAINTPFLIKRIPEEQRTEVLGALRRMTEILRMLGAKEGE